MLIQMEITVPCSVDIPGVIVCRLGCKEGDKYICGETDDCPETRDNRQLLEVLHYNIQDNSNKNNTNKAQQ